MTIKDVKFERDKEFWVCEDGTHVALLEEVSEGTMLGYPNKEGIREEVPCIKFKYVVANGDDKCFIFRDCSLSVGEKSNLTKDMSAVCPKEYDAAKSKDKTLWDLLNSLEGKEFLVTTKQKQSGNGKVRARFVSVAALPKSMKAQDEMDLNI